MPVIIPEKFKKKINKDSECLANVLRLIQNTESLFVERPEFFPDYTIHGITHIEKVLNYASNLIAEQTMKKLTAKDVSLLIAAVILHDFGMFLTKAGVRKILLGDGRTHRTEHLDKCSWEEEWDAYLKQIKRYSEEKLMYYFGIGTMIISPDLTSNNLSDIDKLIIGEFLRRHHHRLAHEIAIGVLPGGMDQDIFAGTSFTKADKEEIGILARSHGMPIRETERYVNFHFGCGYGVPLYYLMAVLRTADYLDAGKGRAPRLRQNLQGIDIPVSVKEWEWNQKIIEDKSYWDSDNIRRYIFAEPESTMDFVQVENWLKSVQNELDLCWSIIAEKYGSKKYLLSIHRIESNILDENVRKHYSDRFLIKEAKLTANPDLLKLLIAPLYGDDPSYGVRELLQNAVDACNERREQEGEQYQGTICIDLDTKKKVFRIRDDGIGMDENTLLNYYLAAGSSYRSSDEWIRQYAQNGMPNFERSGRFGVGVLASFLLGSTVHVQTRHLRDSRGYQFKFGLKPVPLNVERVDCAVGTTIAVELSERACNILRDSCDKQDGWTGWFRFNKPLVQYFVDGVPLQSRISYIPGLRQWKRNWFKLENTGFDMFQWGYPDSGFFCNGIRIPEGMEKEYNVADMVIPAPCVSLIDRAGKLPLDLSRRTLLEFPKEEHLRKSVIEYATAELLMTDWSEEALYANMNKGMRLFRRNSEKKESVPFVCAKDCFSILSMAVGCRREYRSNSKILVAAKRKHTDMKNFIETIKAMEPLIPIVVAPMEFDEKKEEESLREIYFWVQKATARYGEKSRREVWVDSRAFVLRDTLGEDAKIRRRKQYQSDSPTWPPFSTENWNEYDCPVVMEAELPDWKVRTMRGFDLLINQLLEGDPWIPYDMKERRKKYPKAFEKLKYYIDRIIADREKERGAQNA